MFWIWKRIKLLRAALGAKDSARQIAAGLACGMLLGLIPKGNLLAVLVATTLFATRMSLASGMLAAFCVSLLAPLCDPVTHRLGEWVLTLPAFVPLWRSIARLPFSAWTSFNNTVVMGSFLLGTVLMYPVYRLSCFWICRRQLAETRAENSPRETTNPTAAAPLRGASLEREPLPVAPLGTKLAQPSAASPHGSPLLPLNMLPRRVDAEQRRSCA